MADKNPSGGARIGDETNGGGASSGEERAERGNVGWRARVSGAGARRLGLYGERRRTGIGDGDRTGREAERGRF